MKRWNVIIYIQWQFLNLFLKLYANFEQFYWNHSFIICEIIVSSSDVVGWLIRRKKKWNLNYKNKEKINWKNISLNGKSQEVNKWILFAAITQYKEKKIKLSH